MTHQDEGSAGMCGHQTLCQQREQNGLMQSPPCWAVVFFQTLHLQSCASSFLKKFNLYGIFFHNHLVLLYSPLPHNLLEDQVQNCFLQQVWSSTEHPCVHFLWLAISYTYFLVLYNLLFCKHLPKEILSSLRTEIISTSFVSGTSSLKRNKHTESAQGQHIRHQAPPIKAGKCSHGTISLVLVGVDASACQAGLTTRRGLEA